MDKKQFKELMILLKDMDKKMDTLIRISRASAPEAKITDEEKKVLKLCDKKHTIKDIAKITQKTETNINFLLSQLRSKGMIESMKQQDKVVYKRV